MRCSTSPRHIPQPNRLLQSWCNQFPLVLKHCDGTHWFTCWLGRQPLLQSQAYIYMKSGFMFPNLSHRSGIMHLTLSHHHLSIALLHAFQGVSQVLLAIMMHCSTSFTERCLVSTSLFSCSAAESSIFDVGSSFFTSAAQKSAKIIIHKESVLTSSWIHNDENG